MILISHPTGNMNVRNATEALTESGLLGEFWTCVSWNPDAALNQVLPRGLRELLGRRAVSPIVRGRTHYTPWREMGRLVAARLGWNALLAHERGPFCIDAVMAALDRRVARRLGEVKGVTGVYAYEGGAAATFTAARDLGIKCLYDLPIGYWRAAQAIYAEEAEREPEWACTLPQIRNSAAKLARKDEEIERADTVIVASNFTRKTIESAPNVTAPIHVVPYGAPPVTESSNPLPPTAKLRVLFVGSLGQRKGLSYLLHAAKQLEGRVELTLLGAKISEDCGPLNEALRHHRWIPSLAHAGVLREMALHDVFVFPSLFEGFGLVLLEAMAQGLPVITTAHTAGPDLIEEGRDGFIVPIRSTAAIVEKLDLLARDSQLLCAMKIAAHASARRRAWQHYHSQLSEIVLLTTQYTPP